MRNDFRAKQFLPFDSLNGFYEMILKCDEEVHDKIKLSEDSSDILNRKLKLIKKGDRVLVKYYYNLDYVESILTVKKIDIAFRIIYLIILRFFLMIY